MYFLGVEKNLLRACSASYLQISTENKVAPEFLAIVDSVVEVRFNVFGGVGLGLCILIGCG